MAVSEYTRELIISSAEQIDAMHGTRFAEQCRERVAISYPAIDTATTSSSIRAAPSPWADEVWGRDGYVLFLSRLAQAKGVDDLIDGFAAQPGRRTDPGHRRQRAAGRRAAGPWPPRPARRTGSSSSTTSTTTRSRT